MEFCNIFHKWIYPIISSILGAYFIFIIIKAIAILKIKKFKGCYMHIKSDILASSNPSLNNVKFDISCNFWQIFMPILNISIRIKRTGNQGDWESKLYSDILNIYHFRGPYKIGIPEGGDDGWFDAHLFKKSVYKIALHLHFIHKVELREEGTIKKHNRWKEDEGYYIEKI